MLRQKGWPGAFASPSLSPYASQALGVVVMWGPWGAVVGRVGTAGFCDHTTIEFIVYNIFNNFVICGASRLQSVGFKACTQRAKRPAV